MDVKVSFQGASIVGYGLGAKLREADVFLY